LTGKRAAAWVQLVKFHVVGVLNTAVDFAVFTLLTLLSLNVFIAQCLSYSVGIANSYLFHNYWTFANKDGRIGNNPRGSQVIRFVLLNLMSLSIALLLLKGIHEVLGINVLLSKVVVTFFTTILNFIGSKKWVFTD
jgi:putative flippase GtrA